MVLELLEKILALSCFASFLWAMFFFFARPQGFRPLKMRLIGAIGFVGIGVDVAALFLFNKTGLVSSLIACALLGLALSLFWWAVRTNRTQPLTLAFSSDQPRHLVTSGPYGLIRNPFYTSYTLAWLALPVATGQRVLFLIALVMFYLYDQAARFEEGKFLQSGLAATYKEYCLRTKRFLPFLY